MKPLIAIPIFSFFALVGAAPAFAAGAPSVALSFPAGARFAPGSEFTAWVTISSEVPVNAFDISFFYPSALELIGFDTGGVLTDIWQMGPRVRADRTVELVGGMHAPFEGSGGKLVGVEFRAVEEGEVRFMVDRVRFYGADGEGTELAGTLDDRAARVTVVAGAPLITLASSAPDATPPTLAAAFVGTEERAILLAFDAHERESGIAVTLLRTRQWFSWSDWETAMNPVALPRGVWRAELLAVNGSGAETLSSVYVGSGLVRMAGLLLALVVAIGTARVVYNKRKHV